MWRKPLHILLFHTPHPQRKASRKRSLLLFLLKDVLFYDNMIHIICDVVICMKRVLLVFLSFVFVVMSTVSVVAMEAVKGDFNGDGKLSAIDAREILMVSAGTKTATEEQISNCDMDGNGKLSAVDARKILRIVAGLENAEQNEETIELQMIAIIEEEFLRLVNAERVRIGVKPLVKNDILTRAAMVRAQENVTSLSHTRPNGELFSDILKNEFVYEYEWVGENLAYVITGPHSSTEYSVAFDEQSLKDLAKKYYDMFSDDEPHYRNMTRDYFEETGFGVAFYKDESKKTIRVVCCNLFGTPK